MVRGAGAGGPLNTTELGASLTATQTGLDMQTRDS